jgi:hypothetical protein
MTVTLDSASTPQVARRRLPIRMIAIGAAVVLLIAAGVGFAWWDRHPNLIGSVGGLESRLVPVGQATVTDTEVATVHGQDSGFDSVEPDGTPTFTDTGDVHGFRVTIESVRPIVVTNTSDATIRLELCVHNAAHIRIQPDGSKEYDMYCPSYVPVDHQKVKLSDAVGSSMLSVVITPHRAGVVRIAGFRVSYRQGIRRQTQDGGINVTVRSR